jgi:alpha-tubulin suppressor-like RCC1 family protein
MPLMRPFVLAWIATLTAAGLTGMPASAGLLGNVTSIAAGSVHTCAATASGSVKCWGNNGNGQLGSPDPLSLFAMDVPGLGGVVQVAVGEIHSCALTGTGAVKCWGGNWLGGQLGNGTSVPFGTPADVVNLGGSVTAIASGAFHTCALMATGGVKCWGLNSVGQLGDGTTTARNAPVDAAEVTSVAAITAGGSHTCALLTDGTVKCWGNDTHQIGDPLSGARLVPTSVVGLDGAATSVSTSGLHTCAVVSSGAVKCWGAWQAVVAPYPSLPPDSPITPPTDTSITRGAAKVAAGGLFTCVLMSSGGVRCWGVNGAGQLGDGTLVGRLDPQYVSGLTEGVHAISAGGAHACALTNDGNAWCWGANSAGQVGSNQIAAAQTVPARVVSYAMQTITFPAIPDHLLGDPPFQVTATASSGLPVTLSSATPNTCAVSGSTVTLLAPGTCSLMADQYGNDEYRFAAPMLQSFQIRTLYPLTVAVIGNGSGTVTSQPAGIACPPACNATFLSGSVITLNAAAAQGSVFGGWKGTCSGTGSCTVTLNGPTPITATFTDPSIVVPAGPARLSNLSTRMKVLTGEDVMIAGFVIGGTQSKRVVVNVAGPSLANFGVQGPLLNPVLTLIRSSDNAVIATNDNWQAQADPNDVAAIQASGFQPNHGLEPALIATLAPGPYTAIVQGFGGTAGVGLIGVFEVDHPEIPFINISTRGKVQVGDDVMITGFIVEGDSPKTVVINVAGPTLSSHGVANPLANPILYLVRSVDGVLIKVNDDWQTQATQGDAAAILTSGFVPNHPLEPAIIATLPPGAYTAVVAGVNGGTGVAVVGVFTVP